MLDSRTGQSFIPEALGIRSGIFRMFEEMPFMDKLVHLIIHGFGFGYSTNVSWFWLLNQRFMCHMKPQICNCKSTKINIGGTSDILQYKTFKHILSRVSSSMNESIGLWILLVNVPIVKINSKYSRIGVLLPWSTTETCIKYV